MQSVLLFLVAVFATESIASPISVESIDNPVSMEPRGITRPRVTQWDVHTCSDKHIYENKNTNLECVSIDGQTNSITFALGGNTHLIAFSQTNCAAASRFGVITDTPANSTSSAQNPNSGDCIDVNNYMYLEPQSLGTRINSVRFE